MENEAQRIIEYIRTSEKKTPVTAYVKGVKEYMELSSFSVFGEGENRILFGEHSQLEKLLSSYPSLELVHTEYDRRNSAIPMLPIENLNARIEKGAILREQVKVGQNVVIMMGAVINIGAEIGDATMIDMNAVLGGRAIVGKRCHVGAGAVLAGVIEPPSAKPVIIEDDVLIGANAVVLEGVSVGEGSIVAAGAVVLEDVPPYHVVAGIPAKIIKKVDDKAREKSVMVEALRAL